MKGTGLNYRHAFHAGNFADLVKHAALLALLAEMQADAPAVTVIDTHAGRGVYDLGGEEARKSGEAEAGIVRLLAAKVAPMGFAPLLEAVRALNDGPAVRRYPGSPWLIAQALRRSDRYLGCEVRADEHAALDAALARRANVETYATDGYEFAAERAPAQGAVLCLIDPPFERGDDYDRAIATAADVLSRNAGARVLIWVPLKDLETFDAFLRELEAEVAAPLTVAETRMRPLADPLKMNGCALVLVGASNRVAEVMEETGRWTAQTLGQDGHARVWRP